MQILSQPQLEEVFVESNDNYENHEFVSGSNN